MLHKVLAMKKYNFPSIYYFRIVFLMLFHLAARNDHKMPSKVKFA